ncbi:MAG: ATP-dependent helicase [Saprospiraceae bacterium]
MHYLDELNEVQRAAVTAPDGPILVIAGPGSGKTRVLTYRIAHLIQRGVAPWEILALTFTNKSAREMQERIEKVVGHRANQVYAGTFHSLFARFLRADAERLGYPAAFSIYDSDDSASLLRAIIKEMNLDPQVYNVSTLRSRISLAKSNLLTPRAYRENAAWMQQDRQAKRPYIADIYERYVARCKRSGAMDFDDLLLLFYTLLRDHPEVLNKYRQKFQYVHVDEFQDTNFLQYAILRRLLKYPESPANVFCVGDDAQSIYAFRGATIDNILDFEKDFPNIQTYKLEQNYRSTQHIVAAANEIITHNRRQLQKKIWTDRADAHKIKLLRCISDDEEARRVADLILEQKSREHLSNSDIAILYRTNAQSRKFEEHLRRLNLPYRVYGGLSFYQRKEVKDLVAYLRLAVNPQDEEALRRVINYPTRGISPATVDKLSILAGQRAMTMWDAMLSPELNITERARKALSNFRQMVESWRQRLDKTDAYALAKDIYRQSGLQELLKSDNTVEGISRLENAQAVLDAISEFVDNGAVMALQDNDDRTLAAYLQTITLITDADERADDADERITLMSVHAAKGLEFRSVFVTGMEEQLFPSFMSMDSVDGIDEERRLFYVAVTRAKELLTISYAQNRYRFGQMRDANPSRFLNEISADNLDLKGGFGSARLRGDARPTSSEEPRASIRGAFASATRRPAVRTGPDIAVDPSPPELIVAGAAVLHAKFGKGRVIGIEGSGDNKVATIQFDEDEMSERRVVVRFARLQVL